MFPATRRHIRLQSGDPKAHDEGVMPTRRCWVAVLLGAMLSAPAFAAAERVWSRGLPEDPGFFPIGVWLQDPRNAARYKELGINVYVGLWKGPTEGQLAVLREAGMPVICAQNRYAREHLDDPIIVGWMHGDEPDNAQALPGERGYGPPILPKVILEDYRRLREVDSSRPVLLNLGQGVAWDDYIGRGVRRGHPEDYPEYMRGADIVSFDIYPVVHEDARIAGRLEYVATGVERLVGWKRGNQRVWNCIECTHISNPNAKATPDQIRAEVWMALIRGSQGLIYFVHQFKPEFREAALLDDPENSAAVRAINREIRELAPVLNAPSVTEGIEVQSDSRNHPVAWMLKRTGHRHHLFVANLRSSPVKATIVRRMTDAGVTAEAQVAGEKRSVRIERGRWEDHFQPYAVHHYVWEESVGMKSDENR